MGALNLMELNMGPTKVKCITAEKESVQKQDTLLQREFGLYDSMKYAQTYLPS